MKFGLKHRNSKIKCDDLAQLCLADVDDKQQVSAKDKIMLELGLADFPTDESHIIFEVSTLSPLSHETAAQGALATFVDSDSDLSHIPAAPLFRALAIEIRKRSNRELLDTTWTGLVEKRGLGRKTVQDLLTKASREVKVGPNTILGAIEQRLNTELVSIQEVLSIKEEITKFRIAKLSEPDSFLACEAAARLLTTSSTGRRLIDIANEVARSTNEDIQAIASVHGRSMIMAIAMVVLYE